jgi:large subunit ribosomal protein L29
MKDTMTKIRALSAEEINKKIAELKEELFNLKFQAALGNIEKPARMSEIKRTIARMKTVLTEKENASKASE